MTEVWRLLSIQRHKLRFAKLSPVLLFFIFVTLKPVGGKDALDGFNWYSVGLSATFGAVSGGSSVYLIKGGASVGTVLTADFATNGAESATKSYFDGKDINLLKIASDATIATAVGVIPVTQSVKNAKEIKGEIAKQENRVLTLNHIINQQSGNSKTFGLKDSLEQLLDKRILALESSRDIALIRNANLLDQVNRKVAAGKFANKTTENITQNFVNDGLFPDPKLPSDRLKTTRKETYLPLPKPKVTNGYTPFNPANPFGVKSKKSRGVPYAD